MYPQYKSNRGPTPDTVVQGLQYLKASIKAMSIKVLEVSNVVLLYIYMMLSTLSVTPNRYFIEFRCLVLKLMML